MEYGEDGDFGFRGGKCPRGIKIPTFVSSYVSITRESTSWYRAIIGGAAPTQARSSSASFFQWSNVVLSHSLSNTTSSETASLCVPLRSFQSTAVAARVGLHDPICIVCVSVVFNVDFRRLDSWIDGSGFWHGADWASLYYIPDQYWKHMSVENSWLTGKQQFQQVNRRLLWNSCIQGSGKFDAWIRARITAATHRNCITFSTCPPTFAKSRSVVDAGHLHCNTAIQQTLYSH